MPISLRLPIALVLSIVCHTTHAWADYQAGLDAYNRKDYTTALSEWRPLAEQGHAKAQYKLGLLYANGQGVPQEYERAQQWFEKAAAQGDTRAQHSLGFLYHSGYYVPQDFVQAHKWYSLAAANGHKDAAMLRGVLPNQMTPAQIDEAKRMTREWKSKTP